jgi:hypothetical protein
VRVVADSHALIFYLLQPEKLTDQALAALLEAEDTNGVVMSVATIGDLWYASHKSGPNSLAPGALSCFVEQCSILLQTLKLFRSWLTQ